jgi:hypothetical protein
LTTSSTPGWDYQQGLLDLVDAGLSTSLIEEKLHEGELNLPQRTRAELNTAKLESLINWLKGYRQK